MPNPSAGSPARTPAPRAALLAAVPLAVASLVLLLLVAASWQPLLDLDGDISRTAHRRAVEDAGTTRAFRVLTDWVWDPTTMRILCVAVILWLVLRHSAWRTALWLAATCAAGTLLQQSVKTAVDRRRPVWPDPVDSAHYSAFPSGHALTATLVCGLLLWLLHRYGAGRALWWAGFVLAVISVAGVGLTRVWLGVHWPSDVLAGWLLGGLLVALGVLAHHRWVEPAGPEPLGPPPGPTAGRP
ncbi:phosphatase PAP2 family protein [Streptomyces sp. NPDC005907]|uniref:phosphatase PAP2 family protein n=1 Tax=Streptomyces sp. NPDC005907 TaxID=3154571 RepID=UPI0033C29599